MYAGEQIRTFGATHATLVFFEGSRTNIGPNADLVLEKVNGRWGDVLQVEIAQNAGKTNHSVVPLRGKSSSYVVQAPGASASVHGTTFAVAVGNNGQSLFAVNTGKVQVSNNQSQVFVTAGQATLAQPDQMLEDPAYSFSAMGPLTSIDGSIWTVAGVSFLVNEQTSYTGTPLIGDDLKVEGRIVEIDGVKTYIADTVEVALIPQPGGTFSGAIEQKGELSWLIGGKSVLVNGETEYSAGLNDGDLVTVTFTTTETNDWLALSILSLDEATDEIPATATPTPVPGAKPALEFSPEELEASTCETSYTFSGSLVNMGEDEDDYAANVQLDYLIERGAEYVQNIDITPSAWDTIEQGQTAEFQLQVALTDSWKNAKGKDGHVKIRVIIASETNRPDHLKSKFTVNLASCNEEEPVDDEATPTIEPSPTADPTLTPTPDATPDYCTGNAQHPTGARLAERYGVSYDEIMGWFCQHFGFGEIDLAYTLAQQTKKPVAEIFAMKQVDGKGWGQIKQELLQKPTHEPKVEKTPKPEKEKPVKPTQKPKPTRKP